MGKGEEEGGRGEGGGEGVGEEGETGEGWGKERGKEVWEEEGWIQGLRAFSLGHAEGRISEYRAWVEVSAVILGDLAQSFGLIYPSGLYDWLWKYLTIVL